MKDTKRLPAFQQQISGSSGRGFSEWLRHVGEKSFAVAQISSECRLLKKLWIATGKGIGSLVLLLALFSGIRLGIDDVFGSIFIFLIYTIPFVALLFAITSADQFARDKEERAGWATGRRIASGLLKYGWNLLLWMPVLCLAYAGLFQQQLIWQGNSLQGPGLWQVNRDMFDTFYFAPWGFIPTTFFLYTAAYFFAYRTGYPLAAAILAICLTAINLSLSSYIARIYVFGYHQKFLDPNMSDFLRWYAFILVTANLSLCVAWILLLAHSESGKIKTLNKDILIAGFVLLGTILSFGETIAALSWLRKFLAENI
jgi:hypothetical protein